MVLSNVNPELRASLKTMPALKAQSAHPLHALRERINASSQLWKKDNLDAVSVKEEFVPSEEGNIRVISYTPRAPRSEMAAMIYFHGGGMIAGRPETDDAKCHQIVHDLGISLFSVDYRLAPETPYPGPLNDCYAVLSYVYHHAKERGIDPTRIAVGGESAGGNLAAALCLLARDKNVIPIACQLLIYPWLNDRTSFTQDPGDAFGQYRWSRDADRFAWRCYVGEQAGGDGVPAYAAPLRARDLTKLPPAFIGVGALDLFLRDDLEYSTRLMQSGVPVEVDVVAGAYHAFDNFNPDAKVTHRFFHHYCDFLREYLKLS